MSWEIQPREEFSDFLQRMGRKFEIIGVHWTEDRLFEIRFRTQIPCDNEDYNGACDTWVELFSNVTNTVWVKKISNTGPKVRFRKQYQCWTHVGMEVKKEMLFDARRCRGTLDVKVLTDNPTIRRKNKHIRVGLNALVKINFTHLHLVDVTKKLSFFVHPCESQPEAPRPTVQPDPKLTLKVAEILQRGLTASRTPTAIETRVNHVEVEDDLETMLSTQRLDATNEILLKDTAFVQLPTSTQKCSDFLHTNQLNLLEIVPEMNEMMPVSHSVELKMDALQPVSQVMVPQLDVSEHLLMCPPTLMFDPSQIIPVTPHLQHFVPLHSYNFPNQHGHYL